MPTLQQQRHSSLGYRTLPRPSPATVVSLPQLDQQPEVLSRILDRLQIRHCRWPGQIPWRHQRADLIAVPGQFVLALDTWRQ
jgi:hypothetical protein